MASDDDLNELRKIAAADADATDLELQKELTALKGVTRSRLEALRPRLSVDEATFKQLVQAVDKATADNNSIAELTTRLKTLGINVLAVAKKASGLLSL